MKSFLTHTPEPFKEGCIHDSPEVVDGKVLIRKIKVIKKEFDSFTPIVDGKMMGCWRIYYEETIGGL